MDGSDVSILFLSPASGGSVCSVPYEKFGSSQFHIDTRLQARSLGRQLGPSTGLMSPQAEGALSTRTNILFTVWFDSQFVRC